LYGTKEEGRESWTIFDISVAHTDFIAGRVWREQQQLVRPAEKYLDCSQSGPDEHQCVRRKHRWNPIHTNRHE
jgi:hypothetical protein